MTRGLNEEVRPPRVIPKANRQEKGPQHESSFDMSPQSCSRLQNTNLMRETQVHPMYLFDPSPKLHLFLHFREKSSARFTKGTTVTRPDHLPQVVGDNLWIWRADHAFVGQGARVGRSAAQRGCGHGHASVWTEKGRDLEGEALAESESTEVA